MSLILQNGSVITDVTYDHSLKSFGRGRNSLSGKAEGCFAISNSMRLLVGPESSPKHRIDCKYKNMATSASGKANNRRNTGTDSPECQSQYVCLSQSREIIRPTITELTKEVRTNILCTVEGCGKILPNTPALNMHLVKSHRIKVNCPNSSLIIWFTAVRNCSADLANSG